MDTEVVAAFGTLGLRAAREKVAPLMRLFGSIA